MEKRKYGNTEEKNPDEVNKGLRNTEYNEIESDNKYDDSLKDIEKTNDNFELNSEEENQPNREIENYGKIEECVKKEKDKNLDESPLRNQKNKK